jgi:hypothetical protein
MSSYNIMNLESEVLKQQSKLDLLHRKLAIAKDDERLVQKRAQAGDINLKIATAKEQVAQSEFLLNELKDELESMFHKWQPRDTESRTKTLLASCGETAEKVEATKFELEVRQASLDWNITMCLTLDFRS